MKIWTFAANELRVKYVNEKQDGNWVNMKLRLHGAEGVKIHRSWNSSQMNVAVRLISHKRALDWILNSAMDLSKIIYRPNLRICCKSWFWQRMCTNSLVAVIIILQHVVGNMICCIYSRFIINNFSLIFSTFYQLLHSCFLKLKKISGYVFDIRLGPYLLCSTQII